MPSEEQKQLVNALKPLLKQHGFRKQGATWHRQVPGYIQVVNVQGSQWSKTFYINLGVYITQLGDKETPPEYDCHIRNRVNDLAQDRRRYIALVDMENDIPPDTRLPELLAVVEQYAIPWLEKYSNLDGIKDWITGEQPHGLPVSKAVFDLLGIHKE
jgi:hypothetical protein